MLRRCVHVGLCVYRRSTPHTRTLSLSLSVSHFLSVSLSLCLNFKHSWSRPLSAAPPLLSHVFQTSTWTPAAWKGKAVRTATFQKRDRCLKVCTWFPGRATCANWILELQLGSNPLFHVSLCFYVLSHAKQLERKLSWRRLWMKQQRGGLAKRKGVKLIKQSVEQRGVGLRRQKRRRRSWNTVGNFR